MTNTEIDYNKESFGLAVSHASVELSNPERGNTNKYAATKSLIKKLRYGVADIKCHEYEQYGLWEIVIKHVLKENDNSHNDKIVIKGLDKIADQLQTSYKSENPDDQKSAREITKNLTFAFLEFSDPDYLHKQQERIFGHR